MRLKGLHAVVFDVEATFVELSSRLGLWNDMNDPNLEHEIVRIQKTAERQLARVRGLNVALVNKIRKAEAQATTLHKENDTLEHKNANLVTQLSRAQEEVRILRGKERLSVRTESDVDAIKDSTADAERAAKTTTSERQVEAMPRAAPKSTTVEEIDLEHEVERIQKTAEKQLASVHGLNVSLVKKLRKTEAHTATLLRENKTLETKNADLVAKLSTAHEEVHALLSKKQVTVETERNCEQGLFLAGTRTNTRGNGTATAEVRQDPLTLREGDGDELQMRAAPVAKDADNVASEVDAEMASLMKRIEKLS